MTEREALEKVIQCLSDKGSIPVKLNLKKGIDWELVSELRKALFELGEIYQDQDVVPKKLAFVFVDLSKAFERCMPLYDQDEQDKIFDLKQEIVDEGYRLFLPAEYKDG